MTSMYIHKAAKAPLASLLLGGFGFSGCGSRSFLSSTSASLMTLDKKGLLAAMIPSAHKPYVSDC